MTRHSIAFLPLPDQSPADQLRRLARLRALAPRVCPCTSVTTDPVRAQSRRPHVLKVAAALVAIVFLTRWGGSFQTKASVNVASQSIAAPNVPAERNTPAAQATGAAAVQPVITKTGAPGHHPSNSAQAMTKQHANIEISAPKAELPIEGDTPQTPFPHQQAGQCDGFYKASQGSALAETDC